MNYRPLSMFVCGIYFCLLSSCMDAADQQAKQLSRPTQVDMKYLLSLPENYESKEKWPLLLFLHGAGERGDNIEKVKVHGPPKLIAQGEKFPFIVVSPQCPKNQFWQATELSALLDEIIENHHVDEDRIYVTGLSMGGFGTWSLSFYQPYRFAAIAPICGGGDRQFARWIKHLPTWVFHGAKDGAVPVERSIEMVDALKEKGGNPKLTIYPDAEHDSWTETYDNSELYKWFLSHKRQPKEDEKK